MKVPLITPIKLADVQQCERKAFFRSIRDKFSNKIDAIVDLNLDSIKEALKGSVSEAEAESSSKFKIADLNGIQKTAFISSLLGWLTSKGVRGATQEDVQAIGKELFPKPTKPATPSPKIPYRNARIEIVQKGIFEGENVSRKDFFFQIREYLSNKLKKNQSIDLDQLEKIINDSIDVAEQKSTFGLTIKDFEKDDVVLKIFGSITSKSIKGIVRDNVKTIIDKLY